MTTKAQWIVVCGAWRSKPYPTREAALREAAFLNSLTSPPLHRVEKECPPKMTIIPTKQP